MDAELASQIAAIRDDVSSSATVILTRALALMRRVDADRTTLVELTEALREAQPSMAGLWTLAERVRRAIDPIVEIEAFEREIARAPARISRQAASLVLLRGPGRSADPVRLVTCSSSAAVERTLVDLGQRGSVIACCAESRPALEGRALALRLVDAGLMVEVYTDSGISAAVPDADAVLMGADAMGPDHFINKVGTAALCAHAATVGVPVYVLGGREKVLPAEVFDSLTLRSGPVDEVWPAGPQRVRTKNPYFERVSWAHVTMVITDAGPVPPYELTAALRKI